MLRVGTIPRSHLLIAGIAFALFATAVVWVTVDGIMRFHTDHQRRLVNQATSAAVTIERFILDRQRFVEAFSQERSDLLAELYENPEDPAVREKIMISLSRWFPTMFTFTLTDKNGNDLIGDIEGFVGQACIASIGEFLALRTGNANTDSYLYEPQIHPQPGHYHFDIMAPWLYHNEVVGVFFVSFYPETLRKILKSFESPGHSLILVNRDQPTLIEVTSDGSRDKIARIRDIYLDPQEMKWTLADVVVNGTRWEVTGILDSDVQQRYSIRQWFLAVALILGSAMAVLAALIVIGLTEERKLAAQQATEQANGQLRQKVEELLETQRHLEQRGQQLIERAEAEAQLKANLAQEVALKDRFISIIAHDLKSPFTTLLGMAEMITKSSERFSKEQIVDYTQDIFESGRRVYDLLEDLLEWARVQMSMDQPKKDQINLKSLVLENISVYVGPAMEKGVALIDETPDLTALADRNMVHFILRNLIDNAIKFTPDGGKVTVTGRNLGDKVELCVTDTGAGIGPAIANKIFAIDVKTTTLGTLGEAGTGLGLPLCKQMVEVNNGAIWFDSKIGRGTCFCFSLPSPKPTP